MPQRTTQGQAAFNRARNKKLKGTLAGQGRISHALGKSDPRHRRNDQSAQASEQRLGPEFTVDRKGRLRLKD